MLSFKLWNMETLSLGRCTRSQRVSLSLKLWYVAPVLTWRICSLSEKRRWMWNEGLFLGSFLRRYLISNKWRKLWRYISFLGRGELSKLVLLSCLTFSRRCRSISSDCQSCVTTRVEVMCEDDEICLCPALVPNSSLLWQLSRQRRGCQLWKWNISWWKHSWTSM